MPGGSVCLEDVPQKEAGQIEEKGGQSKRFGESREPFLKRFSGRPPQRAKFPPRSLKTMYSSPLNGLPARFVSILNKARPSIAYGER